MKQTRPRTYSSLFMICMFLGLTIAISVVHGQDVPRLEGGARSRAIPDSFDLFGTVWDATPDTSPEAFAKLAASKTKEEFTKNLMGILDNRTASNAVVRAKSALVTKETVTDAQGKFKFTHLPRGVYDVCAEMPLRHSGTGKKRIATVRQQVELGSNLQNDLKLHADLVVVRGRVTDIQGRPVARAKVTGTECPWSEVGVPYSVSVLSRDDGSYELGGFATSDLNLLVGYLAGGNPISGDTRFFVDVVVKADGFLTGHARVPAVTEELLSSGRRLLEVLHHSELGVMGKADLRNMEEPVLPSIHGNTITGINIVMEKIRDAKQQTP